MRMLRLCETLNTAKDLPEGEGEEEEEEEEADEEGVFGDEEEEEEGEGAFDLMTKSLRSSSLAGGRSLDSLSHTLPLIRTSGIFVHANGFVDSGGEVK
jgi:hypothetical protein